MSIARSAHWRDKSFSGRTSPWHGEPEDAPGVPAAMRRRTDSTGEGSVPVRQRDPGGDLHGGPAPETPALRVVAGGAENATRGSEAVAGSGLSREAQFREIYERHFDDVVGWLYALGAPSSDTEDIAQEIFIVVRRNLGRFEGGNLTGWLYRIAQLTVSDYRRRAW